MSSALIRASRRRVHPRATWTVYRVDDHGVSVGHFGARHLPDRTLALRGDHVTEARGERVLQPRIGCAGRAVRAAAAGAAEPLSGLLRGLWGYMLYLFLS
jgi:hypothetical protein